jgi:hypothetical protein
MRILKLAVISLMFALVSACVLGPVIENTGQEVKLRVEGGDTLVVFSPGSTKCRRPNKGPGCIHVAKNEIAIIEFRLLQSANWHLEEIEICKGNEKDSRDCDLDVWERLEFATLAGGGAIFSIPGEDGQVDLTGLGEGHALSEFTLYDQNSFAQEFFYRVKACPNTVDHPDDDCLWTDPPIENNGRR